MPPLQAGESDAMLNVPGVAPPAGHRGYDIQDTQVSPGFFAAMQTPLLRGRSFTEADLAHAGSVVVVNRAFAEKFWPGQDPIGKQVNFLDETTPQAVVIGETPTGKYTALDEPPKPFLYELQKLSTTGFLMMHTAGPPQSVLLTVQQRLRQVDPDLSPLQTGEQFLAVSLFPAHVTVILLSAFGLLALVLAVLGLAYTMSQRRWEFGVRMALGASPGSLEGSVVRRGVQTAAIGVAIGVVLALGASRVLAGLLYQVSPTDPVTYAGVAVLLVLIAALACYMPARRAGRVDPAVTLRTE
ncbi:MAG: FtsX-like permease family protein [Acidobacteria bacterium]|nr:MAG: FtsX-like permease family protein [Acidobacteriota bacterium]